MQCPVGLEAVTPIFLQSLMVLQLFPDFFVTISSDVITFQAEHGDARGKNRPEVFLQVAGEVVEEVEAGEIPDIDKGAEFGGPGCHPGQD